MRLLIISDAWHPQVNGVVRTYEHLTEELIKKGHEVKVIGPADFPWRFPMPGYAEIHLALFPFRRLSKMIEAFNPDHIHVATEGPLGGAGRKYCLKNNQNFTTSYHTHFPDYLAKRVGKFLPFLATPIRNKTIKLIRNFHAPAKTMMVATQSLEDELKGWGFETPMHRLSRGVNLALFRPGEKTLFNDLPRPVALYVGRVAIEKNINAFLDMNWQGSKVIVGHGPSLEMLKRQYPDAHFVGKKEGEELAAHYRSSDIFVFPSKTDTFGIVLIEALASGIPVAGYNVTGPKDIITDPILGAVHDSDLRQACDDALKHDTAQERAKHIKAVYSWENVAAQFEKIM